MKKFWKVRADKFFKKNLESLSIEKDYIDVLIDELNEPLKYIREQNSKYILIICESTPRKKDYFGWEKLHEYNYFINNNYEFCGTINIRKNKLDRINAIYKSAI